jgi:hypothetical protein
MIGEEDNFLNRLADIHSECPHAPVSSALHITQTTPASDNVWNLVAAVLLAVTAELLANPLLNLVCSQRCHPSTSRSSRSIPAGRPRQGC